MEIISKYIEAHLFRIKNNDIEYLVLKRAESDSYPGLWQPVTGSINEDEKAYETALREITEETGLLPKRIWVAPNINSFYVYQNDQLNFVPVFAAEIEPDNVVKISKEHSEYSWVSKEEAKNKYAWHGQRLSVDIIAEYFVDFNSALSFIEIVK